jgi:4-hydroxy-tetrahydrodipicolinate reductase
MRLLVVGHGRMGQLVEKLAPEHGFDVAAIAEVHTPIPVALDAAGPVDVAVEFSLAEAVPKNLAALAARHINVVIGTTGWQEHETELRGLVERSGIGVLASANFSIGMNVFRHVVEQASRAFMTTEVGAWIHEAHHAAKMDAPSGTARLLFDAMRLAGYSRSIDVSSTRAGHIPGTHVVGFDGSSETVTLTHAVRDRAVFAHGALEAAKWLHGKRGWFSMRDMINIS